LEGVLVSLFKPFKKENGRTREKPNSGLNTVYSNVEKYHESDNHLRLRSDKPKGVKKKHQTSIEQNKRKCT